MAFCVPNSGFSIPKTGIGSPQLLGSCSDHFYFFPPPEPENIVTIHAPLSMVFAGSSYTLNCTVMSDLRPVVKWIGVDGNPVEKNTSSITVDAPVYSGNKTYLLLRFPALRTSQAGTYTCHSVTSSPLSARTATKAVIVRGRQSEIKDNVENAIGVHLSNQTEAHKNSGKFTSIVWVSLGSHTPYKIGV